MAIAELATQVELEYSAAYNAHYTTKDLPVALERYCSLLKAHPKSQEASYSRMQIENIVKAVVPEEKLLESHLSLLNSHFRPIDD